MRSQYLFWIVALLGCAGDPRPSGAPSVATAQRTPASGAAGETHEHPSATAVPGPTASVPAVPVPSASAPASAPALDASAVCRDLRAVAVATTVIKDVSAKKIVLSSATRVEPFTSCRNPLEGTRAPKDHFGPAYVCDLEGPASSDATYSTLRTVVSQCFAAELAKNPLPDPVEQELGFSIEERHGKKVVRRACSFSKNGRVSPPSLHWDCHVTMDESRSPN